MFENVLVLGAGSAGLMAALAVKSRMPQVSVTVLRSPEIGVIGVGESTTPNLPRFLFDYLKVSRRKFYELAQPTWKMGVHFLWGPRKLFNYTFERQMEYHPIDLPRAVGFYCDDDNSCMNQGDALLQVEKAFPRQANGAPAIRPEDPFHLENPKYVKALEFFCLERGVTIIDGKMTRAERSDAGIAALHLDDGRRLTADFFIDASGFRSELLGRTLEEPFISFSNSLFNDRAIVGTWDRTDEPILPYTTAETMEAGWCWRIDHELKINRGYVYCSGFITDEQAREEFARKNPKARIWDHVIKIRSGRYQRTWVGNVMAVGNACGFVEPLESSALMVVGTQCQRFAEMIRGSDITASMRDLFNNLWARDWDELRDFLSLHFWPNTRIDNPYWRHCNHDTDISHVKPLLDFYAENGPNVFGHVLLDAPGNLFGYDGFLVILVGNKVPYRNRHKPSDAELALIKSRRANFRKIADNGVGVKEALSFVRHPNWRWMDEPH